MPVVSNTSPILNLAIVGRLDLLRLQFKQVIIPPAVVAELRTDTEFPGASTIREALESGWLTVVALRDANLERALALELDEGEAGTIALALELRVSQVLMDERDGRAKAEAMGLQPVGVLGILLRAKSDRSIASVGDVLLMLRRDAGFFVTDDLAAAVLAEAGEIPPRTR